MAHFDPLSPPDAAYWLGHLRVARFDDLSTLSPSEVVGEFERIWTDRSERSCAEQVLAEWDSAHGRAHLVLLGWYADEKSGRAVEAAAERGLDDQLRRTYLVGRHPRLGLLAGLLHHAPHALGDVFFWDAWHPRSRAAMKLAGQKRKVEKRFSDIDWEALGEAAAPRTGAEPDDLRFERAIPRRDDALLVFRQHGAASVQRDRLDDHPRATAREEFSFLRFHSGGSRVDITARDLDAGRRLADRVGSALFGGEVSYVHARDPLSRERLDALLERLLDPRDQVFKLHEIVGVADGMSDPPTITLRRPGRGQVEEMAGQLRRTHGFARDSRSVDRVKISFVEQNGDHYRMELFFPEEDDREEDLALSLGESGKNKDSVDRFRALMRHELGVDIAPKVADAKRRRRHRPEASRPRKLLPSHYATMLDPVVERPPRWQVEELAALERRGLVSVIHEAAFRCGGSQTGALFRPPGSIACPEEVVLPFGKQSEQDGFAQEPGTRVACDQGHEWHLDRVRPAFWRRARVRVNVTRAADWVATELRGVGWSEDETGVWTKSVRGRGRRTLVVLDIAAEEWRDARVPQSRRLALDPSAVALPHDLTLADLLADGVEAVPRAFGDEDEPLYVREPEAAPYVAEHVLAPSEAGITLDGRLVIPATRGRFRLLFALLQAWHQQHGGAGAPHARRRDLAALDPAGGLSEQDIGQLVFGVGFLGPNLTSILDNQGRKGMRLPDGVRAEGFSLNDELLDFNDRTRRDR